LLAGQLAERERERERESPDATHSSGCDLRLILLRLLALSHLVWTDKLLVAG